MTEDSVLYAVEVTPADTACQLSFIMSLKGSYKLRIIILSISSSRYLLRDGAYVLNHSPEVSASVLIQLLTNPPPLRISDLNPATL